MDKFKGFWVLLVQPFLDQPFLDHLMIEEAVLVLYQSYT
jgi:hypothetical protein